MFLWCLILRQSCDLDSPNSLSLVKHGKTYSDLPKPSLLLENVSCVPAFSDHIWFFLPVWVGGWVCGVQKLCGQKQQRFLSSIIVCLLRATFADGKQERSAFLCGLSCWVESRCNVACFFHHPFNPPCFYLLVISTESLSQQIIWLFSILTGF